MTKILDLGNGFVQVDDYVVQKDVLHIIESVRNYDPNLDVLYLDPDRAGLFDAPWIVVENCPDGMVRKVFEVWELNDSVMERLFNADTKRVDVLLNLDAANSRAKAESDSRYAEKRAEASDKFAHLLANPKTTYSLPNSEGEVIKIDDKYGVKE
jgi:hypothetical protein